MRAQNVAPLLRAPKPIFEGSLLRPSWLPAGRRLHSDSPIAAALPAVPVPQEAAQQHRAPLEDLMGRRHNYLRISLTERCNLRCQYCMPAEGVPLSPRAKLLSTDEVVRVARTLAQLGVTKIRLTGGEPTIRRDLTDIIQELSVIPGIQSVSMTTNGLVLTRTLPALQRAGLTAVNVSLDTLKPTKYEAMARRPGLSRVLAGIDLALQLGYNPVKVNTVLMKGFNDDEICDFVDFTKDRNVEVRFIEFMPFAGNEWDDSKLVPHRTAVAAVTDRWTDIMPCLPRPNDTARVWKVPGYAGSVGFISSMTKNFCSTCNRLRLTADGNLKVCLFGAAEVSLRDAMRSGATDQHLEHLIRTALANKKPQHAESQANGESSNDSNRGLNHITAYQTDNKMAAEKSRKSATSSDITSSIGYFIPQIKPTNHSTVRLFSTFVAPITSQKNHLRLANVFNPTANSKQAREFSTDPPIMSHLDPEGRARMVDVGDKPITPRTAAAECSLRVGAKLLTVLKDAKLPKGDAITVAQIAGVIGAKKTSDLIPMCHPLNLDFVNVKIDLPKGECNNGGDITVKCEVKTVGRTGAEMEALTGAAVAALALYDMCKSVDKHMKIMNLRVVGKTGGRSGAWPQTNAGEVKVRALNTSPIKADETYVPTNVMHF